MPIPNETADRMIVILKGAAALIAALQEPTNASPADCTPHYAHAELLGLIECVAADREGEPEPLSDDELAYDCLRQRCDREYSLRSVA